jgi:hypothetical protein
MVVDRHDLKEMLTRLLDYGVGAQVTQLAGGAER